VSVQSYDWSLPGLDTVILRELVKSYNQKLDYQLIYGAGSSGQHRGIKTVVVSDGGIPLSFSSGGADDLLAKIYEAVSDVSTQAPGYIPNAVVMHPRRAAWFGSHRDALQNLLQQGQVGFGQAGRQDNGQAGDLAGLRVIIDPNIVTNGGAGTNEDDVYVVDVGELLLAESALRTRVLQEVLSGTLQVRLQAYGYSAFAGGRRPKVLARISGAGLGTPTFPST
jgi:HK97 family phage major capsid protein